MEGRDCRAGHYFTRLGAAGLHVEIVGRHRDLFDLLDHRQGRVGSKRAMGVNHQAGEPWRAEPGLGCRVPVPRLSPSHQVPSHRYRSGLQGSPADVGDGTLDCHQGVSSGWSRVIFGFERMAEANRHCRQQQPGNRHSNTGVRFSSGNLAGTLGDAINAGGRKFSAGVGMPGSPMLPRALCRRPGALAPRRPTPDGVCRATAD